MKTSFLFSILLLFISIVVYAQSPKTMSYQGVLTSNDGEALSDGSYTLTFTLYNDNAGGTLLWEEDITTDVSDGIFSVILGQSELLDLPFDEPYWLGVAIDGGDELSPRTALTAAPYSLGGKATELDLKTTADFKEGVMIEGLDTAIYMVPVEGGLYIGKDSLGTNAREPASNRSGIIEEINASKAKLRVKSLLAGPNGNGVSIIGRSGNGVGIRAFSRNNSALTAFTISDEKPAIHAKNDNDIAIEGESAIVGVQGKSSNGTGVLGRGKVVGVWGETTEAGNGTGIFAKGGFAAGEFEGDVRISKGGRLWFEDMDMDNSQERIMVWSTPLGYVKYRTLDDILMDVQEDSATDEFQTLSIKDRTLSISNGNSVSLPDGNGTGFNGCLDNLDFKITRNNDDPVFMVRQVGLATLKGNLDINDETQGLGLNVVSIGGAIMAEAKGEFSDAISAKAKKGIGVYGESDNDAGVYGISRNGSGHGVRGENTSSSDESAGVSGTAEAGIGVYGMGGKAAGLFDGDVLIEEMGQLKIDRVDGDNSDKLLVWADDKFVKTRSLSEALNDIVAGDPFNGCLDDLDFNIKRSGDPFFSITQSGFTTLKGSMDINDETQGLGLNVVSIGGAIMAEAKGEFSDAISAKAKKGIGVYGESDNDAGVYGISRNGSGHGVRGENTSSSDESAGVSGTAEAGIGVYGMGGKAAGLFDGDVLIEEMGQLKIDRVDSDQNDNILVWADDKYVKTRSLNEAVQDLLPDDADMDPTNELFNGTLNDQTFQVNIGGESTFQVNNDRCTFVDGALGVNGILDKPTITSVAQDNVSLFGFNSSPTLPTISIANTIPGGPVFSAQGNSLFGNGTNTFIIFTPGETQVAEFFGDLQVNGVLIATGKSFLIDHPLEPETKQLRHFSIESDRMTNIYNGNAVMDPNGEAWVDLPEWFEALNKNFTYQMTCIGGFANVYIAEEINDNKFKIAGGKPGLKVSWQVTGIRHDNQSQEIDQAVEILKK